MLQQTKSGRIENFTMKKELKKAGQKKLWKVANDVISPQVKKIMTLNEDEKIFEDN
jgi:hypothetical protein